MSLAHVVIIDDDPFVRSSLSAGFKGFGINVVGSGQNFSQAIEFCRNNKVEVIVIDLDLGPGPNGVDISHSIRKEFPQIGLVLLTSYTDPKMADPNMPQLPKGMRFISKSNLVDFQSLINEVLIAKIKPLKSVINIKSKQMLTDAQLEVLKLVSSGLSTQEIASRRGVSEKAIEGLIAKIHSQLGLEKNRSFNQRVQLTRAYLKLTGKQPPSA
jgi:DNA-binding NarL/FixJ family response regulator